MIERDVRNASMTVINEHLLCLLSVSDTVVIGHATQRLRLHLRFSETQKASYFLAASWWSAKLWRLIMFLLWCYDSWTQKLWWSKKVIVRKGWGQAQSERTVYVWASWTEQQEHLLFFYSETHSITEVRSTSKDVEPAEQWDAGCCGFLFMDAVRLIGHWSPWWGDGLRFYHVTGHSNKSQHWRVPVCL